MPSSSIETNQPDLADQLTILHVSDVHFGARDDRAEMPRIAEALIKTAKQQDWKPDVFVFSGDLAFSGLDLEFDLGEVWLNGLLNTWPDMRLFIVPGNHDIARNRANLFLRKAYDSERTYLNIRARFFATLNHLDGFISWHQKLKGKLGERVISDWSEPFGCQATISNGIRTIRFIGLNTSLLSCDDEDEHKLVQDIAALNRFLAMCANDSECVIAVGHHPISWLAEWNREEVERLLNQESGAHLYMHGHLHEQSASSRSTARGERLTVLQSGAAYQGSEWKQEFAFHKVGFHKRQIDSRVFSFHSTSGQWLSDPTRSRSIVAYLPYRFSPLIEPLSTPSGGNSKMDSILPLRAEVELEAYRVLERATHLHKRVEKLFLETNFFGRPIYSFSGRIKDRERIVKKVLARRSKDNDFSVKQIDDVCGFRCVTLYQSDIPFVIERLLSVVSGSGPIKNLFRSDTAVKVTIHTSRLPNDPLSIAGVVEDTFRRWGGLHTIETRSSPTGYSSIHLVFQAMFFGSGQDFSMPVEFQIRSGLEEFWGQLDHKLRYETNRGQVGNNAWQRHLNVLKAEFDAVIQYVDLIKEIAEGARPPISSEAVETIIAPSQRSLSSSEKQLRLLADLPESVYEEVKAAYELWNEADESRGFGGDPNRFRQAADSFKQFVDGRPEQVLDKNLSARLANIALMERAYMLQATQDPDCIEEARAIYSQRLENHPQDLAALFRLGQVLVEQGQLKDAQLRFQATIDLIESGHADDPDDAKNRVYDFVRLNLALAYFRFFENRKLSEADRKKYLQDAIKLSRTVLEDAKTLEARDQALNDLAYYAWEERIFARDRKFPLSISIEKFQDLASSLIKSIEADPIVTFRKLDTLARVQDELGNSEGAINAAEGVCIQLEKAAQERSGEVLSNLTGQRFGGRWAAWVAKYLMNEDERDSLSFALSLVESANATTK